MTKGKCKNLLIGALLGVATVGFADTVLVQWGEPGGDGTIVSSDQLLNDGLDVTYDPAVVVSPTQSTNYYDGHALDRSHTFYGANSVDKEEVIVRNGDVSDYIETLFVLPATESYSAMVVWQDFLATGNFLTSFSIGIKQSYWDTDRSFRWLVQKASGEWYASDPNEDFSSSDFQAYSNVAAYLSWFEFTPFDGGAATVGASPVEIELSDIVSVGYYVEMQNINTASKWCGAEVNYFQVTATTNATPPAKLSNSYDTGYTISKVRTAMDGDTEVIIGSSYEGTVLAMDYEGTVLWTNELSGFFNQDLWSEDLTGDGIYEVLAANSDGSVYCLNSRGALQWSFKANDAPMNTVCVIHDSEDTPYVVCGSFDTGYYYLSATDGTLIKRIESSAYSDEDAWGDDPPPSGIHVPNFLRTVQRADGTEFLAENGINRTTVDGSVYLFEPLADLPFSTNQLAGAGVSSDLRICDIDSDGTEEWMVGYGEAFTVFDPTNLTQTLVDLSGYSPWKSLGYRSAQPEIIPNGEGGYQYFFLSGASVGLVPASMDTNSVEILHCNYAFNDVWKDSSDRIILASSQSGGSGIHILDTTDSSWKTAFEHLAPPGKIASILSNAVELNEQLETFTAPAWERDPVSVYLMTEGTTGLESLVASITNNYDSPIFLGGTYTGHAHDPLDWDRDTLLADCPSYRDRRDSRRTYDWTYSDAMDFILPLYEDVPGIAYWGGHGNDPYMFSKQVTVDVIDYAADKKTVLIWPEIGDTSTNLNWCMNDLFYPLATHSQTNGAYANLFIRSKQHFWSANVYQSAWLRLLSGEFADVFVAALEETNSKTMELSSAARQGLWASGAIDSWGARCAMDNPSLNRAREYSYQRLPNHFLRQMVYNLSSGAQFLNNFGVDQEYMSVFWELIATGALYVPKREEIVSFSPVHVSMIEPDEHYLEDGGEVKWIHLFDENYEENNPFVFSRMNGTWPMAPVTEWDFSRYAAGTADRGIHFLPPYNNGMVMITPPQEGVYADTNAVRGAMTSYMHPLYENIMSEFITDGRQYYSSDGTRQYAADRYYHTVEAAIENGAELLPLNVSGEVAWVCAETASNHLRLTLVDSGYVNPKGRTATVTFHTAQPVAMTDLLDSTATFDLSDPTAVTVEIPVGSFRFIDIEIAEPLTVATSLANSAPFFIEDPVALSSGKAGVAYSASLFDYAADANADALSFSKVSGPAWLTVASDGTLSGTPDGGDIGMNSFVVKVEDAALAYDTATVEITVAATLGGDFTLNPDADAYVRAGSYSSYNYGTATVLACKTDSASEGYTRQAYLRFDLSTLNGMEVTNALLRLKASYDNGAGDTHTAYFISDDSWSETLLTDDNKPAKGTALAESVHPSPPEWLELDVTEQAATEFSEDQELSVVLISSGINYVEYYSKESASADDWPQLVVQTKGASESGWDQFVADHGLSGTPTADSDGDEQNDLYEFVFGGNPTNDAVQGTMPWASSSSTTASYFSMERNEVNPGITYTAEWTTDLVLGSWTNVWDDVDASTSMNVDFDEVEYRLDWENKTNLFFRLRLMNP